MFCIYFSDLDDEVESMFSTFADVKTWWSSNQNDPDKWDSWSKKPERTSKRKMQGLHLIWKNQVY